MTDSILFWNQIAIDANKADFSSPDPATNPSPQQGGPTRTSRALAIVHLAMYDAYVAITGSGKTYLKYTESPGTNNLAAAQAAVATAACITLTALYSRQKDTFLRAHRDFVAGINGNDPIIALGIAWGTLVAARMLAARSGDGSDASDDLYAPSPEPGRHRPDPTNPGQGFLGPLWGQVKPFGITNLTTKVPGSPPPPFNSPAYAADFNQVYAKGSAQGGTRTPEETTIGLFWAYDGPRNIGVPPRLYNQVVRAIAQKQASNEATNAKLFAMVNVAMADSGIQAWYEKYTYNIWRPVLGVRENNVGWGPTGQGSGNTSVTGDPYWTPLGAPRTNQPARPAFTPDFPAYPSGHATFGTAALRVAQAVLCLPDNYAFEFVSDELDGVSVGATGVRARHVRKLTIASAIEENVLSRVYLGVHWQFDGREGQKNGATIAGMIASSFPAMA